MATITETLNTVGQVSSPLRLSHGKTAAWTLSTAGLTGYLAIERGDTPQAFDTVRLVAGNDTNQFTGPGFFRFRLVAKAGAESVTVTMTDNDDVVFQVPNTDGSGPVLTATDSGLVVDPDGPGGDMVRRPISDKLLEWKSAEDFGAIGDGVTDDTAAINRAVSVQGRAIRFMEGKTYLCGNIQPANGVHMFGFAGRGYTTQLAWTRPRLLMKPGSICLLNVDQKLDVSTSGLLLDGNDRSAPVLSAGSSRFSAFKCRFINGSYGVNGPFSGIVSLYSGVMHLSECVIATNDVGLRNSIDGFFIACEVANNGTNLQMQAGSNSNTFSGGRIEWAQTGRNISFGGTSGSKVGSWLFTGTLIDRGSVGSVDLRHCAAITFAGCRIRRGNSSAGTAADQNCNVYIENCEDINFVGVTQERAADDGGGGNTTPDYMYSFGTGNDGISIYGGSDRAGFVDVLRNPTNVTELRVIGVSNYPQLIRSLEGVQTLDGRMYRSLGGTATLAPAAVGTVSLTTRVSVATFDMRSITLEVSVRNTTSGTAASAKFLLSINRGSGSAAITTGLLGEVGTAGQIAFGTGTLANLAISNVAADGASFDLGVTNAHATQSITARAIAE